jgi:hypothetical protein
MRDIESYDDNIWDLLEDSKEISDETKKSIARGVADVKAGRVYSLNAVKKVLGL